MRFIYGALCLIFIVYSLRTVMALNSSFQVEEAKKEIAAGALLIDVRTPAEYLDGHAVGSINIPYDELGDRVEELEAYREKSVVVYCRSGQRSGKGKQTLENLGFDKVINAGGLKEMQSIA
ncbi:MAG: rhodanese-like domain-containing protein, partial [Bdellovibrionales bacterium]|nr:rhodanese-like domain-containing protein [Bdellovibrionales bacterium]